MFQERLQGLIEQQESVIAHQKHISRGDPLFIPIELTGGIGDVICSRMALEEISKNHKLLIYSGHADAFNYFSDTLKAKSGPIPSFTWHLEFNTVARFRFSDQFDGFELTSHRELFNHQQRIFKMAPWLETVTRDHPHQDAALARRSAWIGEKRWDTPLASLGLEPIDDPIFRRRHEPLKIITIHDGYDTSNWSGIDGRSTKQWKWSHWCALAKRIRREFPDFRIFQLGSITSREIDDVDVSLLNKTTIIEAFDFLSRSALHIDGDSGLVHAATHLGIPCVVMFGPTPDYFYGYPQNTNLRAKTCADACYWLSDDWMARCPIGYSTPQCMDDLHPDQVFEAVKEALKGSPIVSALPLIAVELPATGETNPLKPPR